MSNAAAVATRDPSPPTADDHSCDITKPVPVDLRQERFIETLRREWSAVARYMLTLTKDGDWNDKTVVAEWLQYDEAIKWREKLNAALDAARGRMRLWAEPRYDITLHTPPVAKSNMASVGDLLLHERVEPHGEFSLAGTSVFRQFLIAAEVTAVAAGGLILAFRDREGMHVRTPKKNSFVISSSVLDVQGTLAAIAAQEVDRGHWGGEFGRPDQLQSLLVKHQRIQPADTRQLLEHAAHLGIAANS